MALVRISVRLDDDIVDWARIQVAQQNMKPGRFLGMIVEERMRELDGLEKARRAGFGDGPGKTEQGR